MGKDLRRSKSLKDYWQLDGVVEIVSAAATVGSASAQRPHHNPLELGMFAVGRRPVMFGIRERIAGLRTRAQTAPSRIEERMRSETSTPARWLEDERP